MANLRFGLRIKEGIDIENKVKDLMKDLPQLIVALDSLDDSANYIHISDANYETTYYCPCCKSVVKPRACKEDVDYQVQPHFYHENGGCSEESFVRYICKTWLFEKGSKFKIKNNIYTVNNIETEKTFHTQFGDYRPDIVVETEEGKTFFFEIKYSNKKTEHYTPKWDELETDVVEVDAREFINQKHNNDIPDFKLIYSDGECFIKSYSRHDYEDTIAKRKIEWKRQDKLNYKIQWERLDWFWNELVLYKKDRKNIENVISAFEELEYEDMNFCMTIIKKINCQDLYTDLIDIINSKFFEIINSYDIHPYEDVDFIQESSRIFYVSFQICHVDNCFWYNSFCMRRNVEYYDQEVLNIFLNAIRGNNFKKYNTNMCPCYKEIKELKYKKILSNNNVSFYLNDRIAIHWNYSGRRYSKIFDDVKYMSMSSNIISCYNIRDITKNGSRKTLSKMEHATRMNKEDVVSQKNFKVKYLIKKINMCKNGYWNCDLNGDMLEISLKINNDYVGYESIDISYKNKRQIFYDSKQLMNKILSRAKKAYDHESKRLIEEVLHDK